MSPSPECCGCGRREAKGPPPRVPASVGAEGFLQVERLQMVIWGWGRWSTLSLGSERHV